MPKSKSQTVTRSHVDVGCVIHGTVYEWRYVDILSRMVQRNLNIPITMHVWTESDRAVPAHMIKHALTPWPGISGPKKSWWYKLQMFNPEHFSGDLLYFDLDVVICNDLSWILSNDTQYLWTIRDFRYLQTSAWSGMNSSIMWWNVGNFGWVWQKLQDTGIADSVKRYHGDQDFLQAVVTTDQRRFFPDKSVQSWRWSVAEGGWDFGRRRPRQPGSPANIAPSTSILVFHGHPKPHAVQDATIQRLWC